MKMRKGEFIAFEGVDGSGKTTTMRAVEDMLRAQGYRVHSTCEPSGGPIGQMVRSKLMEPKPREFTIEDWLERELLFFADRISHVRALEEVLADSDYVLCDRYILSGLVYAVATLFRVAREDQSHRACAPHRKSPRLVNMLGVGDYEEWLTRLYAPIGRPTATVLIDTSIDVVKARLAQRRGLSVYDRDVSLLVDVQAGFRQHMGDRDSPLTGHQIVVDTADKSVEAVAQEAATRILNRPAEDVGF